MKKYLVLVLSVVLAGTFVGCATSSSFSSEARESTGNLVISTDAFAGTKTVEYKSRKLDAVFAKGGNTVNFEPMFVTDVENNSVTIYLKVKFTSYTDISDSWYKKIIFLSDKGRLTVNLSPLQQRPEIIYRNSLLGTQCRTVCNVQISKEEYLKLNEFVAASASLRCAAYTTTNKAAEMTEQGDSAHEIFAELNDYFNSNLADAIVVPTEEIVIE